VSDWWATFRDNVKVKGQDISVNAINAQGGVEVNICLFLTSVLDGGE